MLLGFEGTLKVLELETQNSRPLKDMKSILELSPGISLKSP